MTLKAISHLYFKSYKLRVNNNTYNKVKYIYFRSFKGYGNILDVPISSINEADLIEFQEHLKERYTNNTATCMYYILIRIFDFAIKIKKLQYNRAKAVKSLRLNRESKVKNVISEDDFYLMLKNIKKFEKRTYLELIFQTGIRSAEARAIQWENVDFKEALLIIDKSIDCKKYGLFKIKPTKTKSSRRVVMLDRITLSLLQKLRDSSSFNSSEDFIFNKSGLPHTVNFCKNEVREACKLANIEYTSIHNLRHSHATNMLRKGVEMAVISKRLGHSDTLITENLYIHLVPSDQTTVIKQIEYRSRNALNI